MCNKFRSIIKLKDVFFFCFSPGKMEITFHDVLNILHERNSLIYRKSLARKIHAISNENHFARIINAGETFPVCLSATNGRDKLKKYRTYYSASAIARLRIVWKN